MGFISGACVASPVERPPVSSASGSSRFSGPLSILPYSLPAGFQRLLILHSRLPGDGIRLGSSD
jgi:hypothetical protein